MLCFELSCLQIDVKYARLECTSEVCQGSLDPSPTSPPHPLPPLPAWLLMAWKDQESKLATHTRKKGKEKRPKI